MMIASPFPARQKEEGEAGDEDHGDDCPLTLMPVRKEREAKKEAVTSVADVSSKFFTVKIYKK